jgi:hypothetical protein
MDFEGRMLGMDRFETESLALLPGQRVRARILGHHPWGISAKIIGYEHAGASIDMIELFGATLLRAEAEAMFPPVGAEIDAVVQQIRRWDPPAWARLSIRPQDLELFSWPCAFCREPVTLSPGGGGLVLDVRSNDGPGSYTVVSHRACLADRLHPDTIGQRARALQLGTRDSTSQIADRGKLPAKARPDTNGTVGQGPVLSDSANR